MVEHITSTKRVMGSALSNKKRVRHRRRMALRTVTISEEFWHRQYVLCLRAGVGGSVVQANFLPAGIRRVKGLKKIGVRLGNWLTAEQSQRLWQAPGGERLKEKRDRALLAVLLACGLRRPEAVELNFGHIQQREEHWAIDDLKGKAGHTSTIPMPGWVKNILDQWPQAANITSGKLFRRVPKIGKPWGEADGRRLSGTTVLLKESLGSEQYQSTNSSIACLYPRWASAEVRLFRTADFAWSKSGKRRTALGLGRVRFEAGFRDIVRGPP